jgi:hypothetical protein
MQSPRTVSNAQPQNKRPQHSKAADTDRQIQQHKAHKHTKALRLSIQETHRQAHTTAPSTGMPSTQTATDNIA